MSHAPPQIIYGAAGVGDFSTDEYRDIFNVLRKHNVNVLDTAAHYVFAPPALEMKNKNNRLTLVSRA